MTKCNKENRSVGRSKRAIEMAFIRLSTQKDIAKISINELAEEANVSRGTVYAHYRDIYDIRDSVYGYFAFRFTENIILALHNDKDNDYPFSVIRRAAKTLKANPEIAKGFLNKPDVVLGCRNIVASTICEHFDFGGNESDRLILCFGISGMVIDTLAAWLADGMTAEPEVLAKTLSTCIRNSSAGLSYRIKSERICNESSDNQRQDSFFDYDCRFKDIAEF